MEANLGLWAAIVAGGALTFAIRLSFIAVHGRVTMPLWFTRTLTFVPVAVLCAIILPEILIQNNALDLALWNPRLFAGIAAVLTAWRTKNVWATIAVGLVVLWGLLWVGSLLGK